MGKPMKAECSLAAVGGTDQAPAALPDSLLPAYRAAVEDLVEEASSHPRPSDLPIVERIVAKRLGQPEFTAVLSYLGGGVDGAADRLSREIRDYEVGTRSSASDLPTFIRILMLSQIDSAWCSETIPFNSDTDVLESTELLDLNPLRSAKVLEFEYRAQPAVPGRARDWAQHKALPAVRPRVAGLRFTRTRPAVLALVNQIAREFAAAAPPRNSPPLGDQHGTERRAPVSSPLPWLRGGLAEFSLRWVRVRSGGSLVSPVRPRQLAGPPSF